jgi:hypothetical protein
MVTGRRADQAQRFGSPVAGALCPFGLANDDGIRAGGGIFAAGVDPLYPPKV